MDTASFRLLMMVVCLAGGWLSPGSGQRRPRRLLVHWPPLGSPVSLAGRHTPLSPIHQPTRAVLRQRSPPPHRHLSSRFRPPPPGNTLVVPLISPASSALPLRHKHSGLQDFQHNHSNGVDVSERNGIPVTSRTRNFASPQQFEHFNDNVLRSRHVTTRPPLSQEQKAMLQELQTILGDQPMAIDSTSSKPLPETQKSRSLPLFPPFGNSSAKQGFSERKPKQNSEQTEFTTPVSPAGRNRKTESETVTEVRDILQNNHLHAIQERENNIDTAVPRPLWFDNKLPSHRNPKRLPFRRRHPSTLIPPISQKVDRGRSASSTTSNVDSLFTKLRSVGNNSQLKSKSSSDSETAVTDARVSDILPAWTNNPQDLVKLSSILATSPGSHSDTSQIYRRSSLRPHRGDKAGDLLKNSIIDFIDAASATENSRLRSTQNTTARVGSTSKPPTGFIPFDSGSEEPYNSRQGTSKRTSRDKGTTRRVKNGGISFSSIIPQNPYLLCNSTEAELGFCSTHNGYPSRYMQRVLEQCSTILDYLYSPVPELQRPTHGSTVGTACGTTRQRLAPTYARATDDRWYVLVQQADVRQEVDVAECRNAGEPCSGLSGCREGSRCVQEFQYRPMIAADPLLPTKCPRMHTFKLPVACTCAV